MAYTRGCLAVLLSMSLLHCQHSLVAAQFLPTTCPKVAPARCPGLCANTRAPARRESGFCIGTQCSRILAETSAATAATAAQGQTGQTAQPQPFQDDQVAADSPWWQQRLQAPAGVDGVVPQRVLPSQYAYADEPQETPEQQAAIVQYLQSMIDVSSACEATEGACLAKNTSSGSSTQEEQQQQQKQQQQLPNSRQAATPPAAAVNKPGTAYTGPASQVTRKLTFISNSRIKLGLDMDRAGAISWLSSPQAPGIWREKNMINVWDQGRLLQQSFYGCVDGSCWATTPWLWNPVQGGSWDNEPGATTRKDVKPARLFVEGNPRNWGKQDLIKSVFLTSDITLKDNYGILKFAVRYTGKVTHPYMTQEVPAFFVDRRFSVLAYYQGSKPWTGDRAVTYAFPPGRNIYARPTENWAAYIDPVTGYGVGLFNPLAWHGITAYRIGENGSDLPWDCSYFAHTIRMQLHVNMRQYNYTVYVTTGKLDEIRATFNKLRLTPGVMPPRSASTADTTCVKCNNGVSAGQPTLGRNPVFGMAANYSAFDNVVAEAPRIDAASSGSSGGANSSGGGATTVAVGAGSENQGAASGLAVQVAEGVEGSDASEDSSSEVKAEVTTTAATGASGQGDAMLLGAGEKPAAAVDDAASRAIGAGANGKTVAGAVVAAFVGCALLAGTVFAVVRSRKASKSTNSREHQQEPGQEGTADCQVQQREAAVGVAAAASSPVAAAPAAAAVGAASPLSPGVLTRSRAALANAQEQATGTKARLSDA